MGIDQFTPTYDRAQRRFRIHELAQGGGFEFIEGDIQTVDLNALLVDADCRVSPGGESRR